MKSEPGSVGDQKITCPNTGLCGGCAWYDLSLNTQLEKKIQALKDALNGHLLQVNHESHVIPEMIPEIIGHLGPLQEFRNRVDFVYTGAPSLGLWDLQHQEILDIQHCSALTPPLLEWLKEFRQFHFPIQKGSIRLRVAPDGTKGAWLDFANLDVKNLLEEKNILLALLKVAIVEIGQKRKRLTFDERAGGRLKLEDPQPHPWFQIPAGGHVQRNLDLQCQIGSFTQTGEWTANHLVNALLAELIENKAQKVLEFGAGIGTLTLPMLDQGLHVTTFEMDASAVGNLQLSANSLNLSQNLEVQVANFQKSSRAPSRSEMATSSTMELQSGSKNSFDLVELSDIAKSWLANLLYLNETGADCVVVDPPRSGLGSDFQMHADASKNSKLPKTFIYVSCFADSFAKDAAQLIKAGYRMHKLQVLDQFSHSPHFEIVATFVRDRI